MYFSVGDKKHSKSHSDDLEGADGNVLSEEGASKSTNESNAKWDY